MSADMSAETRGAGKSDERIAVLGQMRQTAYLSQRGYVAAGLIARID
jgi:alkylhydroperoxidase family enzyme